MSDAKTRERQYQFQVELDEKQGRATLGLMTSAAWEEDPRRLLFLLARYKFVAKMLSGKKAVLEVGCGDAFGTRMILQDVGSVCAVDCDPLFVKDANERMTGRWRFDCRLRDILAGPVNCTFDAAFSLDVLEHVRKVMSAGSSRHHASLGHGVLIIGTPSLHLSNMPLPRAGRSRQLQRPQGPARAALEYFHNVFLFSMNDEVSIPGSIRWPITCLLCVPASVVGRRKSSRGGR